MQTRLGLSTIEFEAKSEGLAYKKLCEIYNPSDARKIEGRGFINMCEVGAKARIYKVCERHDGERYIVLEGNKDNGCSSCLDEARHIKYEQELQEYTVAEIATMLGCKKEDVNNEKIEVVKIGIRDFNDPWVMANHGDYDSIIIDKYGHYNGESERIAAAEKINNYNKVAIVLGCSSNNVEVLLKRIIGWANRY